MNSPSAEHIAALAASKQASRKIRRVIAVGSTDAWSTIVLGGLGLSGSILFFSVSSGLLGAAMLAMGWRQLQATRLLRRLEIDAPRRLAINQLILCAALCVYFGWSILFPSSSSEEPEVQQALQQYGLAGLENSINIAVYGGLIVLSIIVMGSTAWYYSKKTDMLAAYLRQTPDWIIEMQRTSDPL